ncbi:hypothetical protein [Rhodovulum kholense]|uniref:Uncharacterized protein n=3 Tax=Rhodovulum TaxID=34008 RepID=A0A8E2VGC6_9RHOB|nr:MULTISPECIES: hypothetical protein [Rhodovulum]PTW42418.1 hypothetical protein C8N38_12234 [Rhodovulum kholense]RAP39936.1 hypothetical protein BYZ73_17770 [Rhodovulum viride]
MVELLFVACMSLSQTNCEERSLIFTDVSPMSCMMGAQPELAKWVRDHPNWTVSRWQCRYLNRTERKA